MNSEKQQEVKNPINESIYKWIVLLSLSLNSITNVFMFTAILPIWSSVAIYYNTTDYNLNWFTNWYYIGPMTITFVLNPLILNYFGAFQVLSCALTSLGLWLLIFVGPNYFLGMLGFILIGLGESLFFQVPLHLSKLWFQPEERIMSTFIGQYSSNIGMFLGYTVSSFYVYEIVDYDEIISRYKTLLTVNAILATATTFLNLVCLKEPYNKINQPELRDSIWTSIKKIFSTSESIYDLVSVSSFIGLSWCYTMLFSIQQYAIGQTVLEVTWVSVAFQIGQILAALICTLLLSRQSKKGQQIQYDKCLKYTINIGFGCLVVEILFYEQFPIILLTILNIFIGGGLGGLYSVLLESLMEKHFPVQEIVIGSIFAAVSGTTALIITMILVIPYFLSYGFQISCYLMVPSYCYMSVFYETQFRRFELDG